LQVNVLLVKLCLCNICEFVKAAVLLVSDTFYDSTCSMLTKATSRHR